MNKPCRVFLMLALLLCAQFVFADVSQIPKLLSASKLDSNDFGLIVIEGNTELFKLHSGNKFKPASVSKVITAAAVLELLGPKFQFHTQLLHDGTIADETLRGTLYLRGGGDPSFHSGKLNLFLSGLKKRNIKTIEGDLVIDDSRFADFTAQDWKNNLNSLNAQMFPLFVRLEPEQDMNPFSDKPKQSSRVHRRLIDLEGRFVVYQNMIEPDLWTGHTFQELLSKNGIEVKGEVKRGRVSTSAKVLAEIVNPSYKVVSQMMKSSNNYYADLLVRDLSVAFGERPGSYGTGIDFLTFYLDHVKIPRTEYSINSGSGFSHANAITPGAMAKLLTHLKKEKSVSASFLAALPVAATDGTLARRMRKTTAQSRVRAKTGFLRSIPSKSLDGAVSLAGFAQHPRGRDFTFVFFYNGTASPDIVRNLFDNFCILLTGGKPVPPAKVSKAKTTKKKKAPAKPRRKRSTKRS